MTGDQIEDKAGSTQDPLVGTIFADRYEIISRLGEGGMSIVYKARHQLMKKLVAIKMLQAHLVSRSTSVLRFQKEAEAVCRLDHPNIIHVSDFGVSEAGQPYLIMDYLEGISLSELIHKEGRLPVARALHILAQGSDALAHAHSKGIIHRDLKPSNIMLITHEEDTDFVKIVDFGIAKLLPQGGEEQHQLTQTGEVFGSPLYMSPEQCSGAKLDSRSDIYSFGCVMYETLSGTPPIKGTSPIATIHMQMTQIAESLSIPGCDAALLSHLDAMVFKAMEKDAAKRYQTMADLTHDLRQIGQDSTGGRLKAAPTTGLARAIRKFRSSVQSNPVKSAAIALGLIVLSGGAIWEASRIIPLLPPIEKPAQEIAWIQPDSYAKRELPGFADRERIWWDLIRRVEDGKKLPLLIERLNALRLLYIKAGKWNQAIPIAERLHRISKKEDGENCFATADASKTLIQCYIKAGNYKDLASLENMCRKVISTYRNINGDRSWHLAIPRSYLADVLEREGNIPKSEEEYERAVELYKDGAEPDSSEQPMAYCRLADIYRREGKYGESARLYQEALPLWKRFEGGQLNVALCLYHLAQMSETQGYFEKAEKYYRDALKIMEEIWGNDNPNLIGILLDYEHLLETRLRWIDALQIKARLRELLKAQNN